MSKNRLNSRNIMLLVIFCAGFASCIGLIVHGCIACELLPETPVQSPDGKWVLTSITRECPAGLLDVTNYDEFVDIKAIPAGSSLTKDPVRVFENDGSSESTKITWAGTDEAILEVNGSGSVRTSWHQLGNIKFEYVVPEWLWLSLDGIETERLKKDREANDLFKTGKSSSDDLRISLEIDRGVADELTKFREWIINNASVEREGAGPTR